MHDIRDLCQYSATVQRHLPLKEGRTIRRHLVNRSIKHAAEDAAGSVKGAAVDVKDSVVGGAVCLTSEAHALIRIEACVPGPCRQR